MQNAYHHRNILMGTNFQELFKQRNKVKSETTNEKECCP